MPDIRINDFSGGETDDCIDAPLNFYALARNMYVNEKKRLESRDGFGSLAGDILPFGNQKIQKIWNHYTRRITTATTGGTLKQEYETFALSNGVVQRSPSYSPQWVTDIIPDDGTAFGPSPSTIPNVDTTSQNNYIRINDNEFVLTAGFITGYSVKFFRESVNLEWKWVSLGLPRYNDTISISENGAGNNYTYAFVLRHEYQIFEPGAGSITKVVRGEPYFQDVNDIDPPNTNFVIINTPTLIGNEADYIDNEGDIVEGAVFSTDVKWEVYRTEEGGSVFYLLSTNFATPGSAFVDTKSDANLVSGERLYTTGGVLANGMTNNRPSMGVFANDALWLASNNRIWQSKVGIYDAFPGSFNFPVREGEYITAITAIDVYPIVFTDQGVYRIEGLVDDLGNGTHRVRTILETKGALSNKTTVRTDNSIVFWSTDGIYETNGYTARKVSGLYDTRYKQIKSGDCPYEFAGALSVQAWQVADGCYHADERRVHWFYPDDGDTYMSKYITMDMNYPHEEGYCITSGDTEYQVYTVDAAENGVQLGTVVGQVLEQETGRNNDVDPASTNNGVGDFVKWDYKSCIMSFGSDLVRKWFTRILMNFRNNGSLTFSLESDTDQSEDFRTHNPVKETSTTRGYYMLKRGFPKGVLRGAYKQIRMRNTETDVAAVVPAAGERAELNSYTIVFSGAGEGHTQSGVERS